MLYSNSPQSCFPEIPMLQMIRLPLLFAVALSFAVPQVVAQSVTISLSGNAPEAVPNPRAQGSAWHLGRAGIAETLLHLDRDLRLVPLLATDWENTAPDTWVLTLRDNVQFHDGTPLDAAAVKASFDVQGDENHPAHNPRLMRLLDLAGMDAEGMQVTFRTNAPNAAFPYALVEPTAAILRPDGTDDLPLIGTGPFVFVANDPGRRLSARAFPDYWGGAPALAEVHLDTITDLQTARLALMAGDTDLAFGFPETDFARLQRDGAGDLQLFSAPTARLFFMTANLRNGPLSDPAIREAVSLAIDRDALVDIAAGGVGAVPARTIFPESMADWINRDVTLADDPARAAALLDAAGAVDSNGDGMRDWNGAPLVLRLATYEGRAALRPAAEVMQAMLGAVGIGVEVRVAEFDANNAALRAGQLDLHLQAWVTAPVGDPGYFPETLFVSDAGLNDGGYANDRLDALLKQARTAFDVIERRALFNEVQEVLLSDLPLIPLFHATQTSVGVAGLRGFDIHPAETVIVTNRLGRDQ
jgi:peptide/nickel transport system substrate-binding protein